MRSRSWSLPIAGAAILCAFLAVSSARAAHPTARVDLGVAGRTNATPSIAADGDVVAVVWGASLASGATDVFVAMSRDGARTFGAPVRVNDVEGDARLNGEQPPRVTVAGDAVTVVWTTKGANGTTLLHSRSTDGGRTFAKAARVSGTDAAGNRGWENSVAVRSANPSDFRSQNPSDFRTQNASDSRSAKALAERTFVVWLDHRELAKQDSEVAASHHDHAATSAGKATKPDGVAMAQKSKLYIGPLQGPDAPVAVTGGVCYCCKTAIVAGADGSIYAAWRHVYPGNIRDIAFTSSHDGGRTFAPPIRVSEDRWVLEGCPDDGPAMALDPSGRIHIVWPTLVNENGADTIALFYATSADGKLFSPRERMATEGMPHHPQIAVGSDGVPVLAWDEAANGTRRASMARAAAGAKGSAHFARTVLDDNAMYPVVAAVRGAIVGAWTSGGSAASTIRVARMA